MVEDTDSFSLCDNATKDEGKVATSEVLMTTTAELINHCSADKYISLLMPKVWVNATFCSTVYLYRMSC
jgi:hypothetical protein